MPNRRWLRFGVVTGLVAATASALALALASFGTASSNSLGATVVAFDGRLNDHGTVYRFTLNATEAGPRVGEGQVHFELEGLSRDAGLSLCTVTGGSTTPGSTPTVFCGTAGFQAVSIESCKAKIEAHGYSHSDFPQEAIYNGPMTYEVAFEKKGPTSGKLKLTVYTPKKKLQVDGDVTTSFPITMSSCS